MVTIVLAICGLIIEVLLLSDLDLTSVEQQYEGVRLLFWFGISGSAVRNFIHSKRLSSNEQSYKKQLLKHSKSLAELSEEVTLKEEALEELTANAKREQSVSEAKIEELTQALKLMENQLSESKQQLASIDANGGEDSVVMLMSTLQKHGRFLDFVMNDISQLPDERVGAAARVVHQGCQDIIKQYFDIEPIHTDAEGTVVTIDDNASQSQYRIHGATSENLPSSARLIHRGWKTSKVALPKFVDKQASEQRILAPAEIQI